MSVGWDSCLDRVGQLGVGQTAVALYDDSVDVAGLPDELLRGGEVEQRERRAGRRVGLSVAGDADQGELARSGLGDNLDGVADRVVGLVGGALVERDLVAVDGQSALADRPERLVLGDRGTERRWTLSVGSHRFAVFADDASKPQHAAVRVAHARNLGNDRRRRVRQSLAFLGTKVAFDHNRGTHVRVGAVEHVGEQIVERLGQGVGEDVGAGKE